jgi:hypothetical protein
MSRYSLALAPFNDRFETNPTFVNMLKRPQFITFTYKSHKNNEIDKVSLIGHSRTRVKSTSHPLQPLTHFSYIYDKPEEATLAQSKSLHTVSIYQGRKRIRPT